MTLSLGLVSETEAQQIVIDLALRQWRTLVPQRQMSAFRGAADLGRGRA